MAQVIVTNPDSIATWTEFRVPEGENLFDIGQGLTPSESSMKWINTIFVMNLTVMNWTNYQGAWHFVLGEILNSSLANIKAAKIYFSRYSSSSMTAN